MLTTDNLKKNHLSILITNVNLTVINHISDRDISFHLGISVELFLMRRIYMNPINYTLFIIRHNFVLLCKIMLNVNKEIKQ